MRKMNQEDPETAFCDEAVLNTIVWSYLLDVDANFAGLFRKFVKNITSGKNTPTLVQLYNHYKKTSPVNICVSKLKGVKRSVPDVVRDHLVENDEEQTTSVPTTDDVAAIVDLTETDDVVFPSKRRRATEIEVVGENEKSVTPIILYVENKEIYGECKIERSMGTSELSESREIKNVTKPDCHINRVESHSEKESRSSLDCTPSRNGHNLNEFDQITGSQMKLNNNAPSTPETHSEHIPARVVVQSNPTRLPQDKSTQNKIPLNKENHTEHGPAGTKELYNTETTALSAGHMQHDIKSSKTNEAHLVQLIHVKNVPTAKHASQMPAENSPLQVHLPQVDHYENMRNKISKNQHVVRTQIKSAIKKLQQVKQLQMTDEQRKVLAKNLHSKIAALLAVDKKIDKEKVNMIERQMVAHENIRKVLVKREKEITELEEKGFLNGRDANLHRDIIRRRLDEVEKHKRLLVEPSSQIIDISFKKSQHHAVEVSAEVSTQAQIHNKETAFTENILNEQNLNKFQEPPLLPNIDAFTCSVCLTEYAEEEGAMLRECLHTFCRDCLANVVLHCDDAEVPCPHRDETGAACPRNLSGREIRALLAPDQYEEHLSRTLRLAEVSMQDAFHCRTPDCPGFCVHDANVVEFHCPNCDRINCLRCQAVHEGETCAAYKERLEFASLGAEGQKTLAAFEKLIRDGKAMRCPGCHVVIEKDKFSCDWVKCAICKIEICWATRGPRWGPRGHGDTSGGCGCKVRGKKCHPMCKNCH